MRIVMLGLNHRTAAVEVREKLALSGESLDGFVATMRGQFPAAEVVVLSTCNRVEIYLARPSHEAPSIAALRQTLATHTGVALDQLTVSTIHRENEQALEHLFGVATGLDSMVLGEPQIMGQVKQAYEYAQSRQAVGPVLHKVFQQAIKVARHVRKSSGIDAGRVSIGSVAVDFAKQIFEHFDDKTVVGIGTGYMAKLTLTHLKALKPAKLWLVNRSPQRAVDLAKSLGIGNQDSLTPGGARSMDDLDQLLVEADIVLTSTSANAFVITADRFKPLLKQRRSRPLFIIDIAVPRDVDPAVGALRNVYLYNVDDLQQVVAQTHQQRSNVVDHCQSMLSQSVAACMHQVQHRDAGQLIKSLRTRLHDLGQLEQQRTLRKLATADPKDAAALLQEHTHRLINKILHMPLSQFNHRQAGDVPLAFYTAALRKLFQLEPDASDGDETSLEESLETLMLEMNEPQEAIPKLKLPLPEDEAAG